MMHTFSEFMIVSLAFTSRALTRRRLRSWNVSGRGRGMWSLTRLRNCWLQGGILSGSGFRNAREDPVRRSLPRHYAVHTHIYSAQLSIHATPVWWCISTIQTFLKINLQNENTAVIHDPGPCFLYFLFPTLPLSDFLQFSFHHWRLHKLSTRQ